MRLVVFIEPQLGASYDDQLRVARHAEQLGFDRFAGIGAGRIFLQILDLSDLDHLDLIASAVAPQLAS